MRHRMRVREEVQSVAGGSGSEMVIAMSAKDAYLEIEYFAIPSLPIVPSFTSTYILFEIVRCDDHFATLKRQASMHFEATTSTGDAQAARHDNSPRAACARLRYRESMETSTTCGRKRNTETRCFGLQSSLDGVCFGIEKRG